VNTKHHEPTAVPEIIIDREPIELYKILKMENWVASGGEAKFAIADGQVLVNNAVETRKRKKIFSGDTVAFAGRRIQIRLKPA
jgi:ribosome-associated protein